MKHETAEKEPKAERPKSEVKPEARKGGQKAIEAEALVKRLGEDKNLVVLDVFSSEKPELWKIERSERVTTGSLPDRFKEVEPGDVVIYSSENSSSDLEKSATLLTEMGVNVLIYRGDHAEWQRAVGKHPIAA